MEQSVAIVAYLALFAGVGVVFLFVNLLLGSFVRSADPHDEKQEIYECGEPTIGSSFVQFDIRFYVVALLFIIFDVEIAFFFPWATVFGKSVHLMSDRTVAVAGVDDGLALTPAGDGLLREMGFTQPQVPVLAADGSEITTAAEANAALRQSARTLTTISIFDIGAFFSVLLVGFAYVWKRGDLDWVRAITRQRAGQVERSLSGDSLEEEPVLT